MSKPLSYTILGILSGVLIGIVVTYFVLNVPKETHVVAPSISEKKEMEKAPQPKLVSKKTSEEIIAKANREIQASLNEMDAVIQKHAKKAELPQQEPPKPKKNLLQDTSIENSITLDSVLESSPTKIVLNTEEIIVKKEVLLAKYDLNLILNDSSIYKEIKDDSIDSLLEVTSNVVIQNKYLYHIEYWESPIHYKGYKLANNTVVLYGLQPDIQNKLVLLDDHLYFRHETEVYYLSPTFESIPFSIVTDELILHQIHQL